MHLKYLICSILTHNFVPDQFGRGISIPLLKYRFGNVNDMDNYRTITLLPVISKVLESVIFSLCDNALDTDNLQFGFKSGFRCPAAILILNLLLIILLIEAVLSLSRRST